MNILAIITFLWDASPTATHYTLYEQVSGKWVERGQTAQTDIRVNIPKGLRTFSVSASNPWGESGKSPSITFRVKK